MEFARRTFGMLKVVVHLARGATIMMVMFPFMDAKRRRLAIQRWARGVLGIFQLELEILGRPPAAGPVLLVGNHVSWVDVYAYLAAIEACFVAKCEVKSWPLIGWFAKNLGTIFIDRERPRDAIRVGEEIGNALSLGSTVAVFPEGTTSDGSTVLPFSSVLIRSALDHGAPVQPVSIRYERLDGSLCQRAVFIGDKTLLGSLWDLAGGGRSRVRLCFLDAIDAKGLLRRDVALAAEAAVRSSLSDFAEAR